jgi:hypothetical protein
MKRWLILWVMCFYVIQLSAQQKQKNAVTVSPAPESKLKIRGDVTRPASKGWYVYGSASYGIPFISTNKFSPFKEVGNKDWFQTDSSLSVRPLFGTLGGGWAGNLGWGHMFNKNIGIDVLHTIALHPEQLDARINTDVTLPNGNRAAYYAEQYTKIFAMYVSPHLVMHWDNNKRFGITGKAGLCLPIGGSPVSKAKVIDHSGRLLETLAGLPIIPITLIDPSFSMEYTAVAKTKLNPTIGVSASIAFDVRLFKNVWAFAELRVQAFTIKPKETIFSEFSVKTESTLLPLISALTPIPLNIASAAEAPVYLKHFVYRDEITSESNTLRYTTGINLKEIDIDKPMDEPAQKYNASTMYFNLGVRMNFTQNWDKKRAAKVIPKRESKAAKKRAY